MVSNKKKNESFYQSQQRFLRALHLWSKASPFAIGHATYMWKCPGTWPAWELSSPTGVLTWSELIIEKIDPRTKNLSGVVGQGWYLGKCSLVSNGWFGEQFFDVLCVSSEWLRPISFQLLGKGVLLAAQNAPTSSVSNLDFLPTKKNVAFIALCHTNVLSYKQPEEHVEWGRTSTYFH